MTSYINILMKQKAVCALEQSWNQKKECDGKFIFIAKPILAELEWKWSEVSKPQ